MSELGIQEGMRVRDWTTASASGVRRELLEAVERLIIDYRDFPAGSVRRCFARSVKQARLSGYPPHQLPRRAEQLARQMLSDRAAPPLAAGRVVG